MKVVQSGGWPYFWMGLMKREVPNLRALIIQQRQDIITEESFHVIQYYLTHTHHAVNGKVFNIQGNKTCVIQVRIFIFSNWCKSLRFRMIFWIFKMNVRWKNGVHGRNVPNAKVASKHKLEKLSSYPFWVKRHAHRYLEQSTIVLVLWIHVRVRI